MRRIMIVGAGQCGLTLGHHLLKRGYEVHLAAANTADELRKARPTSTQVMFGPALQVEADADLDLWNDTTPAIQGLHMTFVGPPGAPNLDLVGRLQAVARSTDQRVKMAAWLDLFAERGGTIHTMGVSTRDLDEWASSGRFDLIIVAAGRGELAALFDRDASRSPYTEPQRSLAAAYVNGMLPDTSTGMWPNVSFTAMPGAGELIIIPAETVTGPCSILFWEAVPGGPLDVFGDSPGPREHLRRSVDLMRKYTPWHAERIAQLELTDERATLTGRFTPTVRRPVGELPSGGAVLGAADVVIANDPIIAQGANTAAKCAAAYLQAIITQGDEPFDREWMTSTFEQFWVEHAAAVTMLTNAMLQPPPAHVVQLLGAASQLPEVATRVMNGFVDPNDLLSLFASPEGAERYIAEASGRAGAAATQR